MLLELPCNFWERGEKREGVIRSRFSHYLHSGNNKHRLVRVQVQVIGHGCKDWVATEAVHTFLQKKCGRIEQKNKLNTAAGIIRSFIAAIVYIFRCKVLSGR